MDQRIKSGLKIIAYIGLYMIVPVARASGLDFGDLEADVESTIDGGKKLVVMGGFAASILTYVFTRSVKAVAGFVGLIFFAAKGLDIALGYMNL